jgi:hypothetical protein
MDINGTWINQNGSTVSFDTAADGAVSGTYESQKGRAARGKRYALTGRVNGEIVSFQVDWRTDSENLHSITSFYGPHRLRSGRGAGAAHRMGAGAAVRGEARYETDPAVERIYRPMRCVPGVCRNERLFEL